MQVRYGDRNDFLTKFNPDLQMKICKDKELCFFGDAPVLSELNAVYGEMTATMWLVPQLYDLSEYCGCKDKLQGKPLEECASVIATEFYYLKVSEIMLYFHRFKSGRYGRFYGSVDPLVITTSLREFVKERSYEIDRRNQEEEERKREEARKNAIPYEEYCRRKGIHPNEGPFSRFMKSLTPSHHKKVVVNDVEFVKGLAKNIVNNAYGADPDILERLINQFENDYGCKPEEYINIKS